MSEDVTTRAVFERLQRIESRLVRGFEELGVKVSDDADWCYVDHKNYLVTLNGPGRSIRAIQLAIKDDGGYAGSYYDVIVNGETIAKVKGV